MKKIVFLSLLGLSLGTFAQANKQLPKTAELLIEQYIQDNLSGCDTYTPLSTSIDSLFQSVETEKESAEIIITGSLYKEVGDRYAVVSALSQLTFGESIRNIQNPEEIKEKALKMAEECITTDIKSLESYILGCEQMLLLKEEISKFDHPHKHIGWRIAHAFNCKNTDGSTKQYVYDIWLDKSMKQILAAEDTENKTYIRQQKFLKEAKEQTADEINATIQDYQKQLRQTSQQSAEELAEKYIPEQKSSVKYPTCFMDIPMEGTKAQMISKLRKIGFAYNSKHDRLKGKYDDKTDVTLHIEESENGVFRIDVTPVKDYSIQDIIPVFNEIYTSYNLQYDAYYAAEITQDSIGSVDEINETIETDDEPYAFAIFYQKTHPVDRNEYEKDSWRVRMEIYKHFTSEELADPQIGSMVTALVISETEKLQYTKNPVYIAIIRHGQRYKWQIVYINEYN